VGDVSAPAWYLEEGKPSWYLEREPRIRQVRATIYRSTLAVPELIERAVDDGTATLDMRFAVFNRWQEIDNAAEGHFLERIAPGAFAKTIRENLANVKAVLSHGMDRSLGQTVLGKVLSIQEDADAATARVGLFGSVPALLLDGLRAGVYGASFRGDALKNRIDRRPPKSERNPLGLTEVTRLEIRLKDIGPTPFAAYSETSSTIGGVE
jgi:Caudovirus prohead serine protease